MEVSAFAHLVGNTTVKSYLKRLVDKEIVGNSLLFSGPEGVGKFLYAKAFAKLLFAAEDPNGVHARKIDNDNHPDVHIYKPEGKTGMHSISAMREFSEEVYLAPFEGKRKVFIIDDAERMMPFSSNALLKTFEEPSLDAVIMLISSNPSALLPTILSRCRTVRFHPLTADEIACHIASECQMDAASSKEIAMLAHGSLGKALALVRKGESPLRTLLLNMLVSGGFLTYKQLSAMATQIASTIDEAKKEIEASLRSSLGKGYEQSAAQKQATEKEIEGALAVYNSQEACRLFDVLAGWYRDLQLIRVNGNPAYLLHPDYAEAYSNSFQAGTIEPLEGIQQAIADARLALQRSTSIQICFENLFLKLNLLR